MMSLCVLWYDFTLGGCGDRVAMLVGTLGGVVKGTDCAILCCSSSSSIFCVRMFLRVVSCYSFVSLKCFGGLTLSSCDRFSIAAMTWSSSVTSGFVRYFCL